MSDFFTLLYQSKKDRSRLGIVHTSHGDFETPAFMPVGTQATVKTLDPRDLKEIGAQIILANAYHLHLRPGEDTVAQLGGLHQFMNWDGPILTDSGGFQVFSLNNVPSLRRRGRGGLNNNPSVPTGHLPFVRGDQLVEIDEDGVTFRSHLDGSLRRFTPESAVEIQHKLGADIIMAFDQCTRDDASRSETEQAMRRTHQWAERCLKYYQQKKPQMRHSDPERSEGEESKILRPPRRPQDDVREQFLFGIAQGGRFKSLRLKSAEFIASLPFDGVAIGGESVGFNMPRTKKIMDWLGPLLPKKKPRYTMGVGFSPADLFAVVELGIDMFDCVAPTRLARNGALYISPQAGGNQKNKYRLNIANAQFTRDPRPLDPWCDCPVCRGFNPPSPPLSKGGIKGGFSRSYLNHLFRADELLALRLASLHNVRFMLKLMEEIRQAVGEGKLEKLKKEWI